MDRKRQLLKKAWKVICNKHITHILHEIVNTINPSCLRVDIATTFLKSISYMAHIPAIVIVMREIGVIKKYTGSRAWLNRTMIYTPAVTRVEECTSDDTGVGAAIAAGNQDENGI